MKAFLGVPSVAIAFAILAAACDRTPTMPTVSTAPSTPGSRSTLVSISGLVRESLSRPLAGARVEITDGALSGRFTTTGDDGRFSFDVAVETGVVSLRVTKDGYSTATVPWRNENTLIYLTSLSLVDLAGQYTLTFTAASACDQLPPALRTRTYSATIAGTTSSRTLFTSTLGGAQFYAGYSSFAATVANDAARFLIYSWDAVNWWLEDHPIIERVARDGYVSIMGSGIAPIMSSDASIVAAFEGSFSYCAAATDATTPNFPPLCAALLECKSDRHQLSLSRR